MKNISIIFSLFIGLVSICHIHQLYGATGTNESLTSKFTAVIAYYTYHKFKTQEPIPHASTSRKKVVIFDLDGVLLKTDKLKAFQHLGFINIIKFITVHKKLPNVTTLFNALYHGNDLAISTQPAFNQGMQLPQLMVDWQLGLQSLQDLETKMLTAINTAKLDTITNTIVTSIAKMLVDPQAIINTRIIIKDGVHLLHELKQQGFELYAFSNWDADSFKIMVDHFSDLFTYNGNPMFDGIMISGHEQVLKPDIEFFDRFFNKFKLDKSACVFIDDTIENVDASNAYGLDSLHCNYKNYKMLRSNLIDIL